MRSIAEASACMHRSAHLDSASCIDSITKQLETGFLPTQDPCRDWATMEPETHSKVGYVSRKKHRKAKSAAIQSNAE